MIRGAADSASLHAMTSVEPAMHRRVSEVERQPAISPYDEWGPLTRFLESARLTFARERDMWASLGIDDPEHVRISVPADRGRYNVALNKHIDAVDEASRTGGLVSLTRLAATGQTSTAGLPAQSKSRLPGTRSRAWFADR
jgi:hypothetical protein